MGNLEIKIILLCVAALLSGFAILLFYKKKMKKGWMLATVISSFVLAVVGVAAMTFLLQPHVVLYGERTVNVPVFGEYVEKGCSVKLGMDDITDSVEITSNIDTDVVGEYKVTYKVVYGRETYVETRVVVVEDTVKPEIKLNGSEKITISDLSFYEEEGAKAFDNYDGVLTEEIQISQNMINDELYNFVYTAQDSSGNTVTAIREVEIKDIVAPVIKLKNKEFVYIHLNDEYTEYGATATDDLDGDLTDLIISSGNVDTSTLGSYTINYTVSDVAGNITTAERRVIVRVPEDPNKNRICLTFDDGPSSDVTVQILDILKKNNVKATFFICNYSEKKLPIIQRMIDEGHTIGIHGYSHDYAKIYKSEAAFFNNISKLYEKLLNDTGYETNIMRFPGGSSNTVSNNYSKGIMKKLIPKVSVEGWRYFDWNVSSDDATGNLSSYSIYRNTINGLKKNRTNVVLMHDISSKKTTAQALQRIIDYGNVNGYSFWAIDDSIPQIVH